MYPLGCSTSSLSQERLKRRIYPRLPRSVYCQNMLDPQSHHNPQPERSSSSGTLNMIPPWNIHTVKQSMPRSCSNGCSLSCFTPSEFFQFFLLNNEDGWRRFNEETRSIQNNKPETLKKTAVNSRKRSQRPYRTQLLNKIRTDEPHKPKNDEIKQAKIKRKTAHKDFREACIRANKEEIQKTKTRYLETQDNYRRALEEQEMKTIGKRLQDIAKKAKLQPNAIWEIRKKAKPKYELEYNTITEDGRIITDPQETKDHIANYFEELYQARPGTPAYDQWTTEITKEIQSIQSKERCKNEMKKTNKEKKKSRTKNSKM